MTNHYYCYNKSLDKPTIIAINRPMQSHNQSTELSINKKHVYTFIGPLNATDF